MFYTAHTHTQTYTHAQTYTHIPTRAYSYINICLTFCSQLPSLVGFFGRRWPSWCLWTLMSGLQVFRLKWMAEMDEWCWQQCGHCYLMTWGICFCMLISHNNTTTWVQVRLFSVFLLLLYVLTTCSLIACFSSVFLVLTTARRGGSARKMFDEPSQS